MKEESKNLEQRISSWLDMHNDEQRKQFVDTIFDILVKCDITKISQLRQFNITRMIKLIKISRSIDKQSKDLVISAYKIIVSGNDRNEE